LDASAGVTNIGIGSDIQIFNPKVGTRDSESIAQMIAFGCYPTCAGNSPDFDIEFGWIVAPHSTWTYPPQANKSSGMDPYTHLFVFVRSNTSPKAACLVQWNGTGWDCGWNSNYPGGSSDYPGEVIVPNASQPPVGHFVIVYSNGNWWLGYNNKWIGNVSGNWFGQDQQGNYKFSSVGYAQWSGEVGINSHSVSTEMGNGTCGTAPFSAQFLNMNLAESGFTISARDPALYPSMQITDSELYNGYSYTPPNTTNSILSYGGPKGCK